MKGYLMIRLIRILYKYFIKPIFFRIKPDLVHELMLRFGEQAGKKRHFKAFLKSVLAQEDNRLHQNISGISYKSPVGLAAGFNYDGRLINIISSIGFGFQTAGSITYLECKGNPKPNFGRLPKSKSLMVNKGLKNPGIKKIISTFSSVNSEIPLGVSIAKTYSIRTLTVKDGIEDYYNSFKILKTSNFGDYYEINVSCPNIAGGESFSSPENLNLLLLRLSTLDLIKPIYIKLPVDISGAQLKDLCSVIVRFCIQGIIIGNLTKDRNNPKFNNVEIGKHPMGNFSGYPTKSKSNLLIRSAFEYYGHRLTIIGCGGVFSANDAYEKIKLGASLIQLITGMIFEGPQIVAEINYGLSKLLLRDGYSKINQVIGTSVSRRVQ